MMRTILTFAFLAMQPYVPLIDLVSEPSRCTELRSITSSRVGMIEGQQPAKPTPPLSVRLESVSPSATQPEIRIVEILVTNVSGTPYSLPVGRDGNAAMKPGNRGRRLIGFWLRTPGRAGNPLGDLDGSIAYGSESTNGSLLILPPGGAVRVRFPVKLKVSMEFHRLKETGVSSVPVHAALTDMWLDDSRTDTDFISREVRVSSENTLTLPVQ